MKTYHLEGIIERYKRDQGGGLFAVTDFEGLKGFYKKHARIVSENLKRKYTPKKRKKVDWNKFEDTYKKITDILIAEIGESILKEIEVMERMKKLKDGEIKEKLPWIIINIYDSLDNYAAYGESIQKCGEKMNSLIEGMKFNNRLEKKLFKEFFDTTGLPEVGAEIIAACEEVKAKNKT